MTCGIVSNCCKHELYAVHSEAGHGHYVCRKCNMACLPLIFAQYDSVQQEQREDGNADVQP